MADVTSVVRPDDFQLENRVAKSAGHLCPTTKKREVLIFPVGFFGSGHPNYSPFEVHAFCYECDSEFSVWFQWSGPTIFDLGAK
ncbi:MAG: hypothetical protein ACXVGB_00160 [Mycobacteriaceae bacterium]